jgi:SAM-dependent methyltransferase
MTHSFDRAYWDEHWQAGSQGDAPPHPYLEQELAHLTPRTALDAGCGAGSEAIWLASRGWQVTAADISAEALSRAAGRAASADVGDRVRWVEADLSAWEPDAQYDLVTTHYAHPATGQLEFYERISSWVAPGGTLLIVGHLHDPDGGHGHGHGHEGSGPPAEAAVSAAAVTARLAPDEWDVRTARETHRSVARPGGRDAVLHDVVVRATRG